MDISALCEKIELQPAVRSRVLAFSDTFDLSSVNDLLLCFRSFEKMSEALAELRLRLGDDPDNIKILACMLKASADLYKTYAEKGIGDKIYRDTMKCYTRFIGETERMTGLQYFDRYWWTTRQAGFHLFRIGELEYEMKHIGGSVMIKIHIPSDADFSPPAVDASLRSAKEFFSVYFPELSDTGYFCRSWLLDSRLKEMLSEDSNIINFQNRFEIFDSGESSNDFIPWLYNTNPEDLAALPENTSLQRNVKKHLLSGGVIRDAFGRLIPR